MIKKCLLPAAGYGTRFLPATKAMPKEMLPILTKPLIQYAVEEASEAQMTDICFVTGRGKRALEDHFDISFELESQIKGTHKENLLTQIRSLIEKCSFSYTRQNYMLGLGHAILCAKNIIGDEAFGVALADDLCLNDGGDGVLEQMKKIYNTHKCPVIAVMRVPIEEAHKYGVVVGSQISDNLFEIVDMVEKPQKPASNLAIVGRYILTKEIFSHLEKTKAGKNDEIQLTDGLKSMLSSTKILAYEFSGVRYDCGEIDGFMKATTDLYEKTKTN